MAVNVLKAKNGVAIHPDVGITLFSTSIDTAIRT